MLFRSLPLLVGSAYGLAAVAPRAAPNADQTTCYSSMATTSCRYSTQWSTHYTACTVTSTSTKITTVTPSVKSSTSTVTVTTTSTAPSSILTSTQTSTETDAVTITSTQVTVSTSSSTQLATATTTVQAQSGFQPVQDTLPGSSYSGSGGQPPLKREESDAELSLEERGSRWSGKSGPRQYQWPKSVTCHVWTHQTKCSTVTSVVLSTVTASTPSTTVTSTTTATSVFVPSATTTVSTTFTTFSTQTNTATSTSVVTQVQTQTSTTSLYAACATANIADTYNGHQVDAIGTDSGNAPNYAQVGGPNSAYDCCVSALNYPDTSVNVDMWVWDPAQAGCYLGTNSGSCPSGQSSYGFTIGYGSAAQYSVGNAYCGKFDTAVAA